MQFHIFTLRCARRPVKRFFARAPRFSKSSACSFRNKCALRPSFFQIERPFFPKRELSMTFPLFPIPLFFFYAEYGTLICMITITITENEAGQRIDRYLKKYLKNAPLSYVYKLLRKSVKRNGKRAKEDVMLEAGDVLSLYLSEEEAASYAKKPSMPAAKRQFKIAYEDDHVIAVEKPLGLLTHGTKEEKKDTLANQVIDYLIETGSYTPGRNATYTPSPVNRLDRNTTGLVLFAKDYPAARALTRMIREEGYVRKYYLTLVSGNLQSELTLEGRIEKDERNNTVRVLPAEAEEGKETETIARPVAHYEATFRVNGKTKRQRFTLVEVELVTGRTHQIRAHLSAAGYPVIGDEKYGDRYANRDIRNAYGLSTQFLHAYRLEFDRAEAPIEALKGKTIHSALPPLLSAVKEGLETGASPREAEEARAGRREDAPRDRRREDEPNANGGASPAKRTGRTAADPYKKKSANAKPFDPKPYRKKA